MAEPGDLQVLEDLLSQEGEAAAEVVFGEGERCLEVPRIAGDSELGQPISWPASGLQTASMA